ncbi:MAG: immunoglobulin-like domain-containing protein [Bacillota bacterium]
MKMRFIYIGLAILMLLATACQAQPPVSATPVAPSPAAETPSAAPTETPSPTPVPPTPAPSDTPLPQQTVTPSPKPTKAPTPKPGALTMKMAQAVYAPDSEQLKATIKNGSAYTYTFGEASYLQQKTSSGWKTVPFSEDVAWIDIAYMLKPGESKEISLSLSLFSALTPGEYRLAKDVYRDDANATKSTVYAEFRIEDNDPDLNGLTMTMKKDVYSPNSAEVKATLKNGTEYLCTFGVEARLQKKSGSSWKDVPFKEDVAWIALAQLLEPGKSTEVSLSLSLFRTLENGTYRLVKDVSFDLGGGQSASSRATAQFRIG